MNSNKRIIFFVFFLLVSFSTNAQKNQIYGKVVDKETELPLSYVNIVIENTGIGTITDYTGNYTLKIPSSYNSSNIMFSFIGYKTCIMNLEELNFNDTIYLQSEDQLLGEMVIMPDSTLLTLLRKAYKKIPENYPTEPTKLKGFYRETKKTQNQYLYFAEAVIEAYKTGYQKSTNNGQIKILKAMINEFPNADDTLNNIKFYGGPFSVNTNDFVYQNESFINPKYFKNYNYSFVGFTGYNDKPIYIIEFNTNNDSLKGDFEGKIFIDKSTLAYVKFEVTYTERGLNKINIINHNYQRESREINASYEPYKEKWHLKYVQKISTSINKKYACNILEISEFLTTEIFTDTIKSIPLNEQLEYGDYFTIKANEYYNDNYFEEYNILNKDTLLVEQIKMLYTTDESRELLTKETTPQGVKSLFKIISNLGINYGLTYLPIKSITGKFSGSLNTNNEIIEFSNKFIGFDYIICLEYGFFYNINNRWEIGGNEFYSYNKNVKIDCYDIGIAYNFLINKKGKPLGLKMSLRYSDNNIANAFQTNNNQVFTINNKEFDSKTIQLGIGKNIKGIKPKIVIYTKFGKLDFYLSGSYLYHLSSYDMLYISEDNRSIFFQKNSKLFLNDEKIKLKINDIENQHSTIRLNNFIFAFGILINL